MELLGYINDIVFNTYTIKQLVDNKIAVHVPTLKEFNLFQSKVREYNISSRLIDPEHQDNLKEELCLNLSYPVGAYRYKILINYCDKKWYIDNSYSIISMEDIR